MDKLVSVIMAAYNSENTIRDAIESVLSQTYSYWELIIVNDCSTDSTADIIHEYELTDKRIHIYTNDKNLGVSLTRKKALEESNGEWVAILDSDDIWRKEKLEEQIKLSKKRSAELVYTGSGFIDNDGNKLEYEMQIPEIVTYNELLRHNIISNSSLLVKRKLYKDNYVIGDKMHEDYAILLNILRKGILAYGVNKPLIIYRFTNKSKTSNKINSAVMNWRTLRFTGVSLPMTLYYEIQYAINGFKKYSNITKMKGK